MSKWTFNFSKNILVLKIDMDYISSVCNYLNNLQLLKRFSSPSLKKKNHQHAEYEKKILIFSRYHRELSLKLSGIIVSCKKSKKAKWK